MLPDLTPITSLLSTYPRLAQADLSPLRRWLDEGADLDRDILPVIREWTARKPDIYSLGFFSKYVRLARDARMNAPQPATPHQKARRIAFVTRKLGQRHPTEERWLARFETENGPVDWRLAAQEQHIEKKYAPSAK